jgi:hypothetical protein
MKFVTMLGLAAAAAMVLTALLGAGSASATVLCKEYEVPCLNANVWAAKTKIKATLEAKTSMDVKDIHGTVLNTCTGSTIEGRTTNAGGKGIAVVGDNETETFAGCTHAMTVEKTGEFAVHYLGPSTTGTWLFTNDNVTVEVFGATCSYGSGTEDEVGIVESDESTTDAELDFVEAEFTKLAGSLICPPVVFWSGEYLITEPGADELYIKQESK